MTNHIKRNSNEQSIIDIYVAGQNCATSSIKEIGVTLMKRDYPKVFSILPKNERKIMKNKKWFMVAQVGYFIRGNVI